VLHGRADDYRAYKLFGDRSYIELSVGTPFTYGLQRLDLEFTTLDKNGLIFLGMDPPLIPDGAFGFDASPVNFYALQLEDGYLVSLFDFGDGGFKRTVFFTITYVVIICRL